MRDETGTVLLSGAGSHNGQVSPNKMTLRRLGKNASQGLDNGSRTKSTFPATVGVVFDGIRIIFTHCKYYTYCNSMKNILAALALGFAALPASASVIITFAENPDRTTSSLANTQVFDFNSLKTGVNKNVAWQGVGSFDQLYVKAADSYGGAADASNTKGSLYSLQGAGTSVLSSTLKLDSGSAYFGMWWSAGDSKNVLRFYNGDTLVSQFSTSNLMNLLPAEYDGNPLNRRINSGEPYAFINFYGDESTVWDRIVLTNDGSSGFESDNYTSRVAAWDPGKDGALDGKVAAIADGKNVTLVTENDLEGTRWTLDETSVGSAPGAPLPPWTLLAAFAAAIAVKKNRATKAKTAV